MNGQLTPAQVAALLKPIKPHRVMQANGQSHIPAYDVAAHLTRIFGFGGWDKEILSLDLIAEDAVEKTGGKGKYVAWTVTYSCTLRLTIKDAEGNVIARWEDGACGTGNAQPQRGEAHDLAMKSAISYALKRCAAFGLGDQFGLSLYNKGNVNTLIGTTLVVPEEEVSQAIDIESHIPLPQSLGNDENQTENAAVEIKVNKPIEQVKITAPTQVFEDDPFYVALADDVPAERPQAPMPTPMADNPQTPTAGAYAKPITAAQIKQIHILLGECDITDEQYRAVLQKDWGVTTSKDLTKGQAEEVVARLTNRLNDRKKKAS